jgi:hypothetical protein
VRLSRHAENRLRGLKATRQEAESVVRNPLEKELEWRGNARYLGHVGGKLVWVVVAGDDPNWVISIFPKGRE